MQTVTVVGAGVIGLTTAIVLQQQGYDVSVVARVKGTSTTSGAAGAIWLPFRVGPPSRALAWARRTREALEQIADESPGAGVDRVQAYLATDGEERPWWAGAVDDLALTEEGPGIGRAWTTRVPRCDPGVYLPWLETLLDRPVISADVDALDRVAGDLVVNCTGVGARRLASDPELVPNLGQIVVVAGEGMNPSIMVSDDRDGDAMFYVIPRRGEFVIGGCAVAVDVDHPPVPDAGLRAVMLDRCRRAGFAAGEVLYDRTGLRPVRREVRVEREGRIVHNYGHGGAGYTLSWGCAEEISRLLSS